MKEQTLPAFPGGVGQDPELPIVYAQLMVFARELGQLYHAERERTDELQQVLAAMQETSIATMRTLAQVVEAKDLATHGHLERTHAYGSALAQRIDPALAESPEVAYGFFLHDIGKVGIPEAILCKPGPLLAAEWEIMRTHPGLGAQIVAPIRFLGAAVDVIRHHHEWFDGSGYPAGLCGTQIPLAARIFALADSFDAMTSDRPYRDALPIEAALDEIEAGAGTQFDPGIVEVFVGMLEEDRERFELHAPGRARAASSARSHASRLHPVAAAR